MSTIPIKITNSKQALTCIFDESCVIPKITLKDLVFSKEGKKRLPFKF